MTTLKDRLANDNYISNFEWQNRQEGANPVSMKEK